MDVNKEIRKRIQEKFPSLKVCIFQDETEDNIIVAIDDDLYYGDVYLNLIMDIEMNLLWENNIFNYLFVKEASEPVFPPVLSTSTYTSAFPPTNIHDLAKAQDIQVSEIHA